MSSYRPRAGFSFGGPITPAVKNLIIANMVAMLAQVLIPFIGPSASSPGVFSLVPPLVLPWNFQIWRLGTYMFLHGGLSHLFWNMLALFMFGCAIERQWGTRSFYRYYFLCGLGGAAFSLIPYGPFWSTPIIGASGAVYGILLAFGVLFPYREILVFLMFPVQARYLVTVFGFIAFVSSVSGGEGVAHVVHLGGFVTGFVLLRWVGIARTSFAGGRGPIFGSLREAYRRYRMKRLRKKFESYYDKRSGGEPPVH